MQIITHPKIRTRYRIAIFLWFINGTAFILGALYITKYFLIPLFVLFIGIGLYTISLKCPNCGKRVLHNPVTIFGVELYIWTSWIPKRCSKCKVEF